MFFLFARNVDPRFVCPVCEGEEHSVLALPNIMMLHWILNPGLMFNEVFLGQRLPRRLYFCRECSISKFKAQLVHCPECDRFHNAMIWTGSNAFGHWCGFICPDCGGRIPSLLNFTSYVMLVLLLPITLPLRWLLGERYLAWERRRASAARSYLEAHHWKW